MFARGPSIVYFGEKAAEQNLAAELFKHGKTVLLAYGGGSIRKNGVYHGWFVRVKSFYAGVS